MVAACTAHRLGRYVPSGGLPVSSAAKLPSRPGPATPASVGAMALAAALRHAGPALTAPGAAAVSYAQLGAGARQIAAGLAHLGIEPGDRVAILAATRPEWTLADIGAFC